MAEDIPYTMEFLNKFFGNLLLGEKNLLDNREMQIKGKVESKEKTEKSKEKTEKSKEKIIRFISENPQITTNQLGVGPDTPKIRLFFCRRSEMKLRAVETITYVLLPAFHNQPEQMLFVQSFLLFWLQKFLSFVLQ